MRIVVCIKQVPDTHHVLIDPETKRLRREQAGVVMNPFDAYALEEAVRLRARLGGTVTALTMGPSQAVAVVRKAISCGADGGVLLSDRFFAGSDTWATGYALALAILRLGGAELVLCGRQAVDGDTAQVGPGIAAHLGWPQATMVCRVVDCAPDTITIERMHERGRDTVRLTCPAVVSVVKDINLPRLPTLAGHVRAARAQVPVWTAADIGADPERLGLRGSPTRVVTTAAPPPRPGTALLIDAPAPVAAARVVQCLRERSLL